MWLRDSLPYDLVFDEDSKPTVRIMTYGYDSTIPGSGSIQDIEDLATSIHSSLLGLVTHNTSVKPIIFIAHSLGGLIIKQASVRLPQDMGCHPCPSHSLTLNPKGPYITFQVRGGR